MPPPGGMSRWRSWCGLASAPITSRGCSMPARGSRGRTTRCPSGCSSRWRAAHWRASAYPREDFERALTRPVRDQGLGHGDRHPHPRETGGARHRVGGRFALAAEDVARSGPMRVHLGGHLSWYDREKRDWLTWRSRPRSPSATLAAALGLPASGSRRYRRQPPAGALGRPPGDRRGPRRVLPTDGRRIDPQAALSPATAPRRPMTRRLRWYDYITINIFFLALTTLVADQRARLPAARAETSSARRPRARDLASCGCGA